MLPDGAKVWYISDGARTKTDFRTFLRFSPFSRVFIAPPLFLEMGKKMTIFWPTAEVSAVGPCMSPRKNVRKTEFNSKNDQGFSKISSLTASDEVEGPCKPKPTLLVFWKKYLPAVLLCTIGGGDSTAPLLPLADEVLTSWFTSIYE